MQERDQGKELLDLHDRIIIFIGPEGSGKSTIAKKLAENSALLEALYTILLLALRRHLIHHL